MQTGTGSHGAVTQITFLISHCLPDVQDVVCNVVYEKAKHIHTSVDKWRNLWMGESMDWEIYGWVNLWMGESMDKVIAVWMAAKLACWLSGWLDVWMDDWKVG